jgi:uncharacterized protein (TIGR02246 family)
VTPEPAQLRDFARRYTAAWCSQNAQSVAAFYSPDGSLQINDGVPAAGRIAITATVQAFMSSFPDLQVLMGDVLTDDNRTVYHWTLVGTNAGPGGTGYRIRISGFEVWTFAADGLIACSTGHFDESAYHRQLQMGVEDTQ